MLIVGLASAVVVGCLPPFKSLFKGHGSSQRYKSQSHGRELPLILGVETIRRGSAETGGSSRGDLQVMSRPVTREQAVFSGSYDGGYLVPPGAIRVRSDYVSCTIGGRRVLT